MLTAKDVIIVGMTSITRRSLTNQLSLSLAQKTKMTTNNEITIALTYEQMKLIEGCLQQEWTSLVYNEKGSKLVAEIADKRCPKIMETLKVLREKM